MAMRQPHGNAKDNGNPGPRIEVADPANQPAAKVPKKVGQRSGGQMTKYVEEVQADPAFDPYLVKAGEFKAAATAELGGLAGGDLGLIPQSWVEMGSLEMAAARYLYQRAAQLNVPQTGNAEVDLVLLHSVADLYTKISRIHAAARQNMLAAWEVGQREYGRKDRGLVTAGDIDRMTADAEEEASRARAGGGR